MAPKVRIPCPSGFDVESRCKMGKKLAVFVVEIIPVSPVGGERRAWLRCRVFRFGRGHILRAFFERFAGLDIQTMTGAGCSRRKQAVFVVVFGLEKTQNGRSRADEPESWDGIVWARLGSLCHGSADAATSATSATTANDSERGGWLQGGCGTAAGPQRGSEPHYQKSISLRGAALGEGGAAGQGRTSRASSLKCNQNPWPELELELEELWRSCGGGVPSRTSTSTKPYSSQTSSKEILPLQPSPRSADTLNAIPRTSGPNSLSLRASHHGMAPPPVPPPILIKLFEAFHTLDCSRSGREISWTWHLLRTGPTRRS
ncbi:hypothetical protein F5882DRAFT_377308 [Hyaloscypha sp. PMI_1271]|nr:hypothetical protein F5882DRAFT_377308 [Hyaloscypha sp. PMI_1271]